MRSQHYGDVEKGNNLKKTLFACLQYLISFFLFGFPLATSYIKGLDFPLLLFFISLSFFASAVYNLPGRYRLFHTTEIVLYFDGCELNQEQKERTLYSSDGGISFTSTKGDFISAGSWNIHDEIR